MANDVDPGQFKKAQKAANKVLIEDSFEKIALEWWAQTQSNIVQASVKLRRLQLNVFPWVGDMPIREIDTGLMVGVLRRIEDRGAIETARRVRSICGQVFRYAIATDRASFDPTRDLIDALKPLDRGHFSAVTEPQQVGVLLRDIWGYEGSMVVKYALRFAPFVFVRPGEQRQAKWSDIDLDKAEWRYHVTKTDTQHIVPLSRQAVEILQEIEPLTGRGPYVFPSARSADRAMSNNAILAAMRRMGISKDEMTGHGFRAMARTLLDEVLEYPPHVIDQQLAHAVKDPNGRAYNRTKHLKQRREMMQAWADYLDKLKAGGKMIPFEHARTQK